MLTEIRVLDSTRILNLWHYIFKMNYIQSDFDIFSYSVRKHGIGNYWNLISMVKQQNIHAHHKKTP
jgi:hypothetical protein